jgi:hypothetical protein
MVAPTNTSAGGQLTGVRVMSVSLIVVAGGLGVVLLVLLAALLFRRTD